jgi:formylglycine-generating enzyme required for sulfatase activity
MSENDDLVSVIESSEATLDERIAAAHALAALGDPRIGAAGALRIAIPDASCAIDRYPVTVQAFSAFIAGGGYRERRWWSDEGWAWRDAGAIRTPRFWDEAEWASYLIANHPVVGVSYYEAEAYAAFVGARLPSAAEWEMAAGGSPPRKYPWGDEWREDACGMRGFGPRSTVPIGVFPKGRSPLGVSDMVGCVWQWCSDPFVGWGDAEGKDDDGTRFEAVSRRTTCGGAWNTLAWSLTCQSRNGFPKTARFSNLGFRCVVTSAAS